jgi:hypothetical protein
MAKHYFLLAAAVVCGLSHSHAAPVSVGGDFRTQVQPILKEYCYDCHADGANKGGVAFDQFKTDESLTTNHVLWSAVLKNLRAGTMPPARKARPEAGERKQIEDWVKYDAFGIDPANPDPGRVTVRRLNRAEYRNTVRDLLGVDFDTDTEFPADDSGYGFDDIGDVLTISPMLLEKYVDAARVIINKAVPVVPRVVPERRISGLTFRAGSDTSVLPAASGPLPLSYYQETNVSSSVRIEHAGHYDVLIDYSAIEKYVDNQFDQNKCELAFKVDGEEVQRKQFGREGGLPLHFEFPKDWKAGEHSLEFSLKPLTSEKQIRSLTIRIDAVTVRGPTDQPQYWDRPANFARFFPKDAPKDASERLAYARELLGKFAARAYRRPVEDESVNRLAKLAESIYNLPGKTFEAGIANAMVAMLASPHFLFREEGVQARPASGSQALIDEYSLASRLSYFLWSSMPDDELFQLAREGKLRKNLAAQVKRMLADQRSEALSANFTGQWLQARDIATIPIDARAVLARDTAPDPQAEASQARFRELSSKVTPTDAEKAELQTLRASLNGGGRGGRGAGFRGGLRGQRIDLTPDLRKAMERETEMYFSGIVHEDRSVMELVESDYTYLNASLAKHYGLTNLNVTGADLMRVTLPEDSTRGGVLTMGTVLAVTSNPTRTSPVKRGLFILQNILGNPVPAPPPNIPPLEASEKASMDHQPTLREVLEIHRTNPTCANCHGRMDPLGLAFENFNAMGMSRTNEHGQVIDPSGKLITGESFKDVRELKHILATDHRDEFYRTLTEKLLTYALGRGLEYYDVETVDEITARLQRADGHFSALLIGIIESAPFQKTRSSGMLAEAGKSAAKSQ